MVQFAVLTGDIVKSSDLGAAALDEAMTALDHASREMSGWANGMVAGFARRGGDGWQVALGSGSQGLRAALYLQAMLRRLGKDRATRIAIATQPGRLDRETVRNLNTGHGPAFTASGRLLEDISGQALMAHADGGAVGAAVRLADHISQGWTVAQARAMVEALPPKSGPRADMADRLGITRQAVNQALWSGGFPALSDALRDLECDTGLSK